jgi:hypothetical protein
MDDVAFGASACTDGELLERTRAGHREAFGVLYERRRELVLAFLLKRTHNPEVAMDLMAETFAAALVALSDRPPAIEGSKSCRPTSSTRCAHVSWMGAAMRRSRGSWRARRRSCASA